MDEIDWLRRVEQAAWSARIRQLRRELIEERTKQQVIESVSLEVAPPSNSNELKNNPHLLGANALVNSSAIRKIIPSKESSYADIRKDGANHQN